MVYARFVTKARHAQPPSPKRALLYWTALLLGAVVLAGVVVINVVANRQPTPPASPAAALAPAAQAPPQSTPPQSRPDQTGPDNECTITFTLAGAAIDPQATEPGALLTSLPVPESESKVFGGWYSSADAAAQLDQKQRVGGASVADCAGAAIDLYGAWTDAARVEAEDAYIPILMYHQFTEKPEGEDHWLRDNFTYIGDFESHLQYLKDQEFYFPTWLELHAFLEGKLYLPSHSVIITDDDADPTWNTMAAPLAEKFQVPITSFVIGVDGPGPDHSQWVWKRSHTYDMHSAGEDGQGRMVNWGEEAIAADLEKSAEVLGGAKEVVAYPFGHHNETAHRGLTRAGFLLGRTTEPGYVTKDTSPMALPVVRVNFGMSVADLAAAIN